MVDGALIDALGESDSVTEAGFLFSLFRQFLQLLPPIDLLLAGTLILN